LSVAEFPHSASNTFIDLHDIQFNGNLSPVNWI
jgi:hypothetical protein